MFLQASEIVNVIGCVPVSEIVIVIGFVPVSEIVIIIRLFQCNRDCNCLLIVIR